MTRLARSRRPISPKISAVDLFCGAGGLTQGLLQAGVSVVAGIDTDIKSAHAYEQNNKDVKFLDWDVSKKKYTSIGELFPEGSIKLLAGCAPCQPFSKLTNGQSQHTKWTLLDNFGRYVRGIRPEVVTMENVPELASRGSEVFKRFTKTLERNGYSVDWAIVNSADYGVPQQRKRLILLASLLGPIKIPRGRYVGKERWKTVRKTIGGLPRLNSGGQCTKDRLHVAALLSPTNLERIQATPHDGGSRRSWPDHLIPDCYRQKSGERYYSIYGRMWWDQPGPTMTTLCTGLGNGRFGHPEQDRAITLREAALIQSFPKDYEFWPKDTPLNRGAVARMIGNAVPPLLAKALGRAILSHISQHHRQDC
jgi:DNA (cytosine-5)-methyltransferase 1